MLILFAALYVLAGLIFLLWCMSLAVRVKCGTVWSNNLISRRWRWLVAPVTRRLFARIATGKRGSARIARLLY